MPRRGARETLRTRPDACGSKIQGWMKYCIERGGSPVLSWYRERGDDEMRNVAKNLKRMSPACRWLLKGGLMLTSALLFCSIVLSAYAGSWSLDTYYLHRCADTMREMAPVILFITVFGSAWWEERYRKTGT